MDSPTPLSESNLRRYKGVRTSKKSLLSCKELHPATDGNLSEEALGQRSVSLTALTSELQRSESSPGNGEPRLVQLESLEAKMANIEVSLSNHGAGKKKRGGFHNCDKNSSRSFSQYHHHAHGASTYSVHTNSHNSTHNNNNNNNGAIGKDMSKEIHLLKQSLKDKENLILNLQGQLRKLSKRKLMDGSITSTDSGVVSLRILSETERKAAEDRLAQLDKEMDEKRGELKKLKHRLQRLNPSDNIDIRIQQAELEYQLEREELNLMNLQEERRNLHTILDDNDAFQKRNENSLFSCIPVNGYVGLYAYQILYDSQDALFTVGKREDRTGTYVTWTRDDLKTLKRGDRIVEINGTIVVSKGVNRIEEFWCDEETLEDTSELSASIGSHPLRIVVLRSPPPPPPPRTPNKEIHSLKEEVAVMTRKLEELGIEKKDLNTLCQRLQKDQRQKEEESEKIKLDTEKVMKERDNFKSETVRLKHRISYLEDQISDMVQKKEVQSSKPVTVFQKGSHKAIVADSVSGNSNHSSGSSKPPYQSNSVCNTRASSPCRPASVASSRNSESRTALKTRLWETFRRATSTTDARSVCSIDSSKKNSYFRKKIRESSKKLRDTDAITSSAPPKKPARHSLQRATSTSNVYCPGEPIADLNPSLKRSNYSDNTLFPQWLVHAHHTTDQNSDVQSTTSGISTSKKKHHGIRWPSLKPANSMSYTMTSLTSTSRSKS